MNSQKKSGFLRAVVGVAAVALAGATISAQAALVNVDWQSVGDQQILRDTGSGLDWLGLTNSGGLSYNFVTGQLGGGGLFEGFRFATATEVGTLFTNAGIPDIDVGYAGTAANVPGATALMGLWHADIWGLHDSSGEFGYFFTADVGTGLLWTPPTGTAEATTGPDRIGAGGNPNHAISYLGSALVRVSPVNGVPDHGATVALVGVAFLAMGVLRRKFGAQ